MSLAKLREQRRVFKCCKTAKVGMHLLQNIVTSFLEVDGKRNLQKQLQKDLFKTKKKKKIPPDSSFESLRPETCKTIANLAEKISFQFTLKPIYISKYT